MGFHLPRLLHLYGIREFAAVYMQGEYISPELARTGWQRATEFSWEARSKSNCPTVRRSRVLFLLQAHPRKVGRPREELIIRYEPSRGERVVPVTKNERWRESEVKETGKEAGWKKMEGEEGGGGNGRKRKSRREPSTSLSSPFQTPTYSTSCFLQIPQIHAAKFQLLDRSTRNAKWVTIKAGRRWCGKEGYNDLDVYLCGALFLDDVHYVGERMVGLGN